MKGKASILFSLIKFLFYLCEHHMLLPLLYKCDFTMTPHPQGEVSQWNHINGNIFFIGVI